MPYNNSIWMDRWGNAQVNSLTPRKCNVAVELSNLDSVLNTFWKIEAYPPNKSNFTEEELNSEKHFVDNVKITDSGRMQVLGNSLIMAKRKFFSVERHLQRDEEIKKMHVDFMREYEALGHMTEIQTFPQNHYFIPHHYVLRPESKTIKLRVVFDASARTTSNISLNEIQMVGPTIQQDLLITLLSFRLNRFALIADISKMHRQFFTHNDDRNFQLILWQNSSDEPMKTYQLNTVTYGMSSATFLAIRCLLHIADLEHETRPIGATALTHDIYVDDLLTRADNLVGLQTKKKLVTAILSKYGLDLAK